MTDFLLLQITVDSDYTHEIRRRLFWQESCDDKPRQYVEKQRQYSVDKVPYSQGYGLPKVAMYSHELDRKVGRMLKN